MVDELLLWSLIIDKPLCLGDVPAPAEVPMVVQANYFNYSSIVPVVVHANSYNFSAVPVVV